MVIPSLDAATLQAFRKINRPHPRLNIATVMAGLIQFRKEYSGNIWMFWKQTETSMW